MLDRALAWARLGVYIFPQKDGRPLVAWGKDATTDPAVLRAWWSAWPDAQPCAACKPSGLVVVDLDRKNGKDGVQWLADNDIDLPSTWTCDTRSGGIHAFYKAGPERVHGKANYFAPECGVDVKAAEGEHGGMVRLYTGPPIDFWDQIPTSPEWLPGARSGASSAETDDSAIPEHAVPVGERFARALAHVEHLPPSVEGQNGDDALYSAAQVLVRGFQLPSGLALRALEQYNAAKASPPWPVERLAYKAAQAASSGAPWGYMLDEFLPSESAEGAPPFLGGPESKATFTWIYGSEAGEPLPPVKWCVEQLQIAHGRPTLLTAYGFAGKTISAQAMLLSFAAGKPIWGHFPTNGGVIRHLDYEQGRTATLLRYQRLGSGLEIDIRSLDRRFGLACFPELYLSSPTARDSYAKVCDGADLVLVDALRGTTPGVDENDSRIRSCIDALSWASERTGCAFVLIHHGGKGDSKLAAARGSSAIFDGCGAVYTMTGERGEPKTVEMIKSPALSSGGAVENFDLAIRDVGFDGLRVEWQAPTQVADDRENPSAGLDELIAEVLTFVRANPGITGKREVAVRMGRAKDSVNVACDILLNKGRIVNRGTTARPRFYSDDTDPGSLVVGDF